MKISSVRKKMLLHIFFFQDFKRDEGLQRLKISFSTCKLMQERDYKKLILKKDINNMTCGFQSTESSPESKNLKTEINLPITFSFCSAIFIPDCSLRRIFVNFPHIIISPRFRLYYLSRFLFCFCFCFFLFCAVLPLI